MLRLARPLAEEPGDAVGVAARKLKKRKGKKEKKAKKGKEETKWKKKRPKGD